MMVKKFSIILLLLGIITIGYNIQNTDQFEPIPAPDINFTTLNGKNIQLKELRGRPVIITFWATDCQSCIKEIPHLIDLYKQFHPMGLEIIAIAMYYDLPNHVVYMTKAKQIPYYVTLDLKAEHAKAFGHVKLTPTTLLISPAGTIVMQKTGMFDIHAMKQRLDNLG